MAAAPVRGVAAGKEKGQAWRSLVSGRSDDGSLRPEEDVYASQ